MRFELVEKTEALRGEHGDDEARGDGDSGSDD